SWKLYACLFSKQRFGHSTDQHDITAEPVIYYSRAWKGIISFHGYFRPTVDNCSLSLLQRLLKILLQSPTWTHFATSLSSPYADLEEAAKKERKRIEDVLISKGVKHGSYPRFTVAVKGQKITVKFQISPSCDISVLIAHLVSHLGLKSNDSSGGSDMLVRSWDSHPVIKETSVTKSHKGDVNKLGGELCIVLFRSLVKTDKAVTIWGNKIEFLKHGTFSAVELDALVSVLQLAGGKLKIVGRKPVESAAARAPTIDQSVTSLKAMGVRIYGLKTPLINSTSNEISWENIAGYDKQKRSYQFVALPYREIEDTILLALHNPEIYDNIARGTRDKFESNRPRAVLFEGPPGTGKTSCARVIANQAGVPLLYVPLEVVVSKYYGESERQLGKVFSLANELPNGAIIFLDEVDSFAVTRDGEMHEATRRILSVLLRQIDGFEQDKKVVVIAATNRKQDLDPALISRFDSVITFGLPDQLNRQEIIAQYAKHLMKSDLERLATVTEKVALDDISLSGRDIKDVCQQAERSWASKRTSW
ncbi:Protein CdcH, partial [Linum grandiflorum]